MYVTPRDPEQQEFEERLAAALENPSPRLLQALEAFVLNPHVQAWFEQLTHNQPVRTSGSSLWQTLTAPRSRKVKV